MTKNKLNKQTNKIFSNDANTETLSKAIRFQSNLFVTNSHIVRQGETKEALQSSELKRKDIYCAFRYKRFFCKHVLLYIFNYRYFHFRQTLLSSLIFVKLESNLLIYHMRNLLNMW